MSSVVQLIAKWSICVVKIENAHTHTHTHTHTPHTHTHTHRRVQNGLKSWRHQTNPFALCWKKWKHTGEAFCSHRFCTKSIRFAAKNNIRIYSVPCVWSHRNGWKGVEHSHWPENYLQMERLPVPPTFSISVKSQFRSCWLANLARTRNKSVPDLRPFFAHFADVAMKEHIFRSSLPCKQAPSPHSWAALKIVRRRYQFQLRLGQFSTWNTSSQNTFYASRRARVFIVNTFHRWKSFQCQKLNFPLSFSRAKICLSAWKGLPDSFTSLGTRIQTTVEWIQTQCNCKLNLAELDFFAVVNPVDLGFSRSGWTCGALHILNTKTLQKNQEEMNQVEKRFVCGSSLHVDHKWLWGG